MTNQQLSRRNLLRFAGVGLVGLSSLAACQSSAAVPGAASASPAAATAGSVVGGYLAAGAIHQVTIAFAAADYQAMLAAYLRDESKQWLTATVTIDGAEHPDAGIRLKGNSSLKGVTTSSKAEELPWLVRLDKTTQGANHDGMTEFVIRSNSSKTALNEAVALDLLAAAGLPSERVAYVSLTVNGSDPVLRLTVENLGDAWVARTFPAAGLLYKAEATGDYSWRGRDAASYDEVFDQETGADDLTPLIEFLDFVNNAKDAAFVSDLGKHLDVAAFTSYLALQALIDNFDDIDGPGNNSFLWWDRAADRFTVVAWDHNLAFGLRPGGAGGPAAGGRTMGGSPGTGAAPVGQPPSGQRGGPPAGGGGGPGGKANPLVTRFTSLLDGQAKVTAAQAVLKADLYTSGRASSSLDAWSALLTAQAAALVPAATLASERDAVAAYFSR